MPQPVQPSVHMEQPYSSESMPVQSPQRFRRTLLQQVQLPVFRPDELPREGFFDNEQESYRNQFPNACKPQVWNPQCQSMSDTGWEEVQRVPQDFELPRPEQWTKVGSYLCIKHAGYYPINHTRCWQRT